MHKLIAFSILCLVVFGLTYPVLGNSLSSSVSISEVSVSSPVIEDIIVETAQNIAVQGQIPAKTADLGSISIQVTAKPQKGSVSFNGLQFTYQPYKDMTGSDQFAVCAVDSIGNYSRDAVITVYIDKNNTGFFYSDMSGNPSAYAAFMLRQHGVYSGVQIGESILFQPEYLMNRGDFLVLLISASGLEHKLRPTVNTGLPNDNDIPNWLKPYVRTGIEAGILSETAAFNCTQIPTRAEAVVLTDRAAEIYDVKDYHLSLPDLDGIPEWALASYKDLAAYKMLDLYTGYAQPLGALSNSYAADLSWQLYKHKHR